MAFPNSAPPFDPTVSSGQVVPWREMSVYRETSPCTLHQFQGFPIPISKGFRHLPIRHSRSFAFHLSRRCNSRSISNTTTNICGYIDWRIWFQWKSINALTRLCSLRDELYEFALSLSVRVMLRIWLHSAKLSIKVNVKAHPTNYP